MIMYKLPRYYSLSILFLLLVTLSYISISIILCVRSNTLESSERQQKISAIDLYSKTLTQIMYRFIYAKLKQRELFNLQQNQHIFLSFSSLQIMLQIQASTIGLMASSDISTNQLQQQICLFLRQSNKFGIKIKINRRVNVLQLMKIAEIEFNIPMQNQMIWIASKKYDVDDYIELELETNTIVHVHDKNLQNCTEILLFLQQINKNGTISKPVQYKVSREDKISDFINTNFNKKKLMLVESGRKLNQMNTFKAEFISNGSTIYYEQQEIKNDDDEVQNDFNKLFQDDDEEQKQQTKKQSADKVYISKPERRQSSHSRKNAFQEQFSSGEEMEMFELKPNFKKKKSICLKAVSTNPEDPNMCSWKRDFSQQSSKHEHKLAKVLKAKKSKDKQEQQKSDDSPRSQKMSMSQKVKLKNQFQKLFTSQNLGLRPASKSKPSGLFQSQRNEQQNTSKQKHQQNRNNQLF